MDLFDILLVKKLIGKVSSDGTTDKELQEIIEQLKEKVSKDEMELYVTTSIENLPVLSQDEIINLTK